MPALSPTREQAENSSPSCRLSRIAAAHPAIGLRLTVASRAALGDDPILDERGLVQRKIKTDRYGIRPTRAPPAPGRPHARPARALWELNGEPMETAGEVIANIGLVMEHLDREAATRSQAGT
jgi:hypothetical protein